MGTIITNKMRGKICAVSSCGRFGVIALHLSHQGYKYAVINGETQGRVALMSKSPGGRLVQGARVVVEESILGAEAFLARKISEDPAAPLEPER